MGFEVGGFDCKERDRNLGWMMRDRMLNLLIILLLGAVLALPVGFFVLVPIQLAFAVVVIEVFCSLILGAIYRRLFVWIVEEMIGCWRRGFCVVSVFLMNHRCFAAYALIWWGVWMIGLVLFVHFAEAILVMVAWWGLGIFGIDECHWLIPLALRLLLLTAWGVLSIRYFLRYFPCWSSSSAGTSVMGPFWEIPYICDAPILATREDELQRGNFVKTLQGRLMGTFRMPDCSAYIGLYGEWGEGKTSVYNLLRVTCKDLPLLFVDFAPWSVLKRENLPEELFAAISKAVERHLPERAGKGAFKSLGLFMASRRFASLISLIPNFGAFFDCLLNSCANNDRLRSLVKKDLLALSRSHRIVVVLDDLDRMPPKDVCELIRLIRTNNDLPNITYLLIGDPEHMASALQQMLTGEDRSKDGNVEGRTYLEKILPVTLTLPPVPPIWHQNFFMTSLRDMLARHPRCSSLQLPTEFECEAVFPFLKTARCVRRLLTAVEGALGHYENADHGDPRIHLADVVAIKAMELFEIDFYHRLYERRNVILGFDSEYQIFNTKERSIKRDAVEKEFYPHAKPDGKLAIQAFFNRHLMLSCVSFDRGVRPASGKVEFVGNQIELQGGFRLASAAYFDKYFIGISDDTESLASVRDVKAFHDVLDKKDDAENFLVEMGKSCKVKSLLRLLESQPPIQSTSREHNYLSAILKLGDNPVSEQVDQCERVLGMEAYLDVYTIMTRCILFYFWRTSYDASTRSGILTSLIRETGSVAVAVGLIGREDGEDGRHKREKSIFTEEDFVSLRELVLDRVEELQREGRLIGHPRERDLRHGWRIFAKHSDMHNLPADTGLILQMNSVTPREDRFVKLLRNDFSQYPQVLYALQSFREYSSSDPVWFSPIWCDELEKLMGSDVYLLIEKALEEHSEDLCEDGVKLLEAVRFIMAFRAKEGRLPSTDEQRSHLLKGEGLW